MKSQDAICMTHIRFSAGALAHGWLASALARARKRYPADGVMIDVSEEDGLWAVDVFISNALSKGPDEPFVTALLTVSGAAFEVTLSEMPSAEGEVIEAQFGVRRYGDGQVVWTEDLRPIVTGCGLSELDTEALALLGVEVEIKTVSERPYLVTESLRSGFQRFSNEQLQRLAQSHVGNSRLTEMARYLLAEAKAPQAA